MAGSPEAHAYVAINDFIFILSNFKSKEEIRTRQENVIQLKPPQTFDYFAGMDLFTPVVK